MWLFIKKWYFLEKLNKAIKLHTLKESIVKIRGGRVLLTKQFFIEGNEDFPGLAYESTTRFSFILIWRKRKNIQKLKARISEYNDIFDACIKEGIIDLEDTSIGSLPSVGSNLKFHEIHGLLGLIQALLSRYKLAWTGIIVPIVVFLLSKLMDFI